MHANARAANRPAEDIRFGHGEDVCLGLQRLQTSGESGDLFPVATQRANASAIWNEVAQFSPAGHREKLRAAVSARGLYPTADPMSPHIPSRFCNVGG